MYDFTFCAPTQVCFGKDSEKKLVDILKERGCKRVLLHFGGESAEKSGLLQRVRLSLESAGARWSELGGVKPNPRLSLVYEGIEICKRENIDLILAVGGGSVIDSAKAIGIGAADGGDVWDFYCRKRVPRNTVPVGVILTIAAAGSEMSKSSVITNEKEAVKRGLNIDVIRPAFCILNPELTLSVPKYQTACGCVDIFMHTCERYLTGGDTMDLTDALAEALMTTVIKNSSKALNSPDDYGARAELMWAGSLSHNCLTECGSDGGDWTTHLMGQELSARYDSAHGATLSALWGSWARYVYKNCIARFYKFAVQVMGVCPNGTQEELALKGIEAAEEWFASLGMPTSISGLGVSPSDEVLAAMAKSCAHICGGEKGSCKKLHEDDMLNIYLAAK